MFCSLVKNIWNGWNGFSIFPYGWTSDLFRFYSLAREKSILAFSSQNGDQILPGFGGDMCWFRGERGFLARHDICQISYTCLQHFQRWRNPKERVNRHYLNMVFLVSKYGIFCIQFIKMALKIPFQRGILPKRKLFYSSTTSDKYNICFLHVSLYLAKGSDLLCSLSDLHSKNHNSAKNVFTRGGAAVNVKIS